MTKIYLVRHGQASFSKDNYDKLSDLGVTQACLLNEYLAAKNIQPDVIITGSMLRHKETAEYSLKYLHANESLQQIDANWDEYDHQNILGVFDPTLSTPQKTCAYLASQAEPMVAFQQLFITAITQWTQSTQTDEYSESWQQFTQRVLSALNRLAVTYPNKTVVVYTSGGPISLVASYLLGLPLEQFIHINWSLVNGGVTKVISRGKNKQFTLSTLNEHHIFEQQNNKKLITYT